MLQPCMIHTSPPMTTKTWPLTSAASSDASQATRGEMFSGRNRSNWLSSSGALKNSMESVIAVRARGAMALPVTP